LCGLRKTLSFKEWLASSELDCEHFADGLAMVRRKLWRVSHVVQSADPEFLQFPRKAFDRMHTGLPLTASLAKAEL
jgi:hypothetical protein